MGLFSKKPTVTYEASRLRFVADRIEPLRVGDLFEIITPHGTFRMTKGQFYSDLANVVASASYRNAGYYHYPTIPARARKYEM
jgi:hypothetical protein